MKGYRVAATVAAVLLLYAASAAAINLKPDNPHDFKGNLTVESNGKKKKIEDIRVMLSKNEIKILPGRKSGMPDRRITAKSDDTYADEKGRPVLVKVLDKTKGLVFTFSNGEVYTFHKQDD